MHYVVVMCLISNANCNHVKAMETEALYTNAPIIVKPYYPPWGSGWRFDQTSS